MYDNVKLVKLVSGDIAMGVFNDETKELTDVVQIQTIPTAGSVQIAILPFGFPYEEDIKGRIDSRHILYEYSKVPEELSKKYMEAKSNIRIASSLDNIGRNGNGGLIL